jgi:3-dehydroquinate synthase
MQIINVKASSSYDVIISAELLCESGKHIKNSAGGSTAAIITDDKVYPLYGQKVENSLSDAGYNTVKYIIKNGEASKNAANYIKILNFLSDNRLTRSDVVVALGGGVVGDLAGFAAATYLRGIHLIQIPTTLLAAVDSSVGGKTAIDLDAGKNLAGAFYQPDLVLCDYSAMSTLDETVFRDGCAEIIKYGVIADKELFYKLFTPVNEQLEDIIARCVLIKRDIVCEDERDNGMRRLHNFGHTIGHAAEVCSGYNIPHGSAVSMGMAALSRACAAAGICSPACCEEIVGLLKRYKLPTEVPFDCEELIDAALSDKKRSDSIINIVVPVEIGRCVVKKITLDELKEIIRLGIKSQSEV